MFWPRPTAGYQGLLYTGYHELSLHCYPYFGFNPKTGMELPKTGVFVFTALENNAKKSNKKTWGWNIFVSLNQNCHLFLQWSSEAGRMHDSGSRPADTREARPGGGGDKQETARLRRPQPSPILGAGSLRQRRSGKPALDFFKQPHAGWVTHLAPRGGEGGAELRGEGRQAPTQYKSVKIGENDVRFGRAASSLRSSARPWIALQFTHLQADVAISGRSRFSVWLVWDWG